MVQRQMHTSNPHLIPKYFSVVEITRYGESKLRLSLPGSVFYNALSISSTDFDEGHRKAVGHPASVVIPVALVLGNDLKKKS